MATIKKTSQAPAFGTYFLSFEVISRVLSGSATSNEASSGAIFMAGGFAGMSSWLVSYPMDVVKSRIQVRIVITTAL